MFNRFGNYARKAGAQFVEHMSPISMFNIEQTKKLGADAVNITLQRNSNPAQWAKRVARHKASSEIPLGARVQGYFNGINPANMVQAADVTSTDLFKKVAAQRATTRRMTVGVLGAATIGSLALGRGNAVTEGGTAGVTAGGVGLAASGIAAVGHRMGNNAVGGAGAAALVGWTALNMYRSGDNWGPF